MADFLDLCDAAPDESQIELTFLHPRQFGSVMPRRQCAKPDRFTLPYIPNR